MKKCYAGNIEIDGEADTRHTECKSEKGNKAFKGWSNFIINYVCTIYPVWIMLLFAARIVNLTAAARLGESYILIIPAVITALGSLAGAIMFIIARNKFKNSSQSAVTTLYIAWALGIVFNGIIPVAEHIFIFHSHSVMNIIEIIVSAALFIYTIVYFNKRKFSAVTA